MGEPDQPNGLLGGYERPLCFYDNKYIESVWWLISQMNDKGMLYKGHTIQPYLPKAGTGLKLSRTKSTWLLP